jgi:hypothetical protein
LAGVAEQLITARPAVQRVAPRPAVDLIAASVPEENVVTIAALDDVGPSRTPDGVVAVVAVQRVLAVSADEEVRVASAVQHVVAVPAVCARLDVRRIDEGIIAVAPLEHDLAHGARAVRHDSAVQLNGHRAVGRGHQRSVVVVGAGDRHDPGRVVHRDPREPEGQNRTALHQFVRQQRRARDLSLQRSPRDRRVFRGIRDLRTDLELWDLAADDGRCCGRRRRGCRRRGHCARRTDRGRQRIHVAAELTLRRSRASKQTHAETSDEHSRCFHDPLLFRCTTGAARNTRHRMPCAARTHIEHTDVIRPWSFAQARLSQSRPSRRAHTQPNE